MIKILLFLLTFSLYASEQCRQLLPQGEIKNFFKDDPALYRSKELIQVNSKSFRESIYPSNSLFFTKCQQNSAVSWEKTDQDQWTLSWAIVMETLATKINQAYQECVNEGKTEQLKEEIKLAKDNVKKHFQLIRKCHSLKLLTNQSDYEAGEEKKKKSFDNAISCVRHSVLTQDWNKCVALIQTYDAAHIALQAIIATQTIDFKSRQDEISQKISDDAIKGPINAQIEILKVQQKYGQQQAALYSAQATAIGVAASIIPTMKELLGNCSKEYPATTAENEYTQIMKALDPHFRLEYQNELVDIRPETVCPKTVQANRNLKLIANAQAIDAAKTAVVELGIKAGTQILVADLIGKNIKKLETMLADIENFNPSDLNYSLEDLIAEECTLNPSSDSCLAGKQALQNKAFAGSSISIASNGYAQTNTISQQDPATTSSTQDNSLNKSDNTFAPIDDERHTSARIENKVNAGSVKSSSHRPNGGSNSVSVGSVAAPSTNNKNTKSNNPSQFKEKKYHYNQAPKSTLYRGSTRKQATPKKDNFFTKLFKSKVTTFKKEQQEQSRGVSIFKVISNRYHMVEKSKRLLEYSQQ